MYWPFQVHDSLVNHNPKCRYWIWSISLTGPRLPSAKSEHCKASYTAVSSRIDGVFLFRARATPVHLCWRQP